MKIRWKQGYRGSADVDLVHTELEAIRQRDGHISPEAVLRQACADDNPMHEEFIWDDSEAAHAYRLEQARSLIRSIEVVYEDAPTKVVRAYSVVSAPPEYQTHRKVYTDTREALTDPVTRAEILATAIREALAFRRKYADLQELSKVITAFDEFLMVHHG